VYLVQPGSAKNGEGKPTMVAQQRFVRLGPTRGDQVAVESGVAAGDVIVNAGQMKLHNGTVVVVNNSLIPKDDVAPTPPNE
jgi:membrane fusion protein (multidrug efflux system)